MRNNHPYKARHVLKYLRASLCCSAHGQFLQSSRLKLPPGVLGVPGAQVSVWLVPAWPSLYLLGSLTLKPLTVSLSTRIGARMSGTGNYPQPQLGGSRGALGASCGS